MSILAQKWYKNYYFYLVLGITILAAVLRLYGLAGRDIWFDEALDVAQAQKGFWAITNDVGTPIHYYFVWAMLPFGVNTVSLALPGVTLCIATVPLFYFFVKDLLNKNAAVITACLLAISPMLIEFSQQILHYAYLVFFTTLSLFFIGRLIVGKRKILFFILWVGATILNLLTMAPAFLIAAIEIIFLVAYLLFNFRRLWPTISRWFKKTPKYVYVIICALAGIGVFLFSISYYPKTILEQTAGLGRAVIPVGYSLNLKGFTQVEFSWPFMKAILEWFGTYQGDLALGIFLSFCLIGLVLMVWRKKYTFFILSLLWIVLPFVVLYKIGISHWFEEKYFIFVIPIYLATIAYGITSLGDLVYRLVIGIKERLARIPRVRETPKSRFVLLTVLIVFTFGIFVPLSAKILSETYISSLRDNGGYSWGDAFEYIAAHSGPDDWVVQDESLLPFTSFYLGVENENKTWFPETYFSANDTASYEAFIDQVSHNRKIWLPTLRPFAVTSFSAIADLVSVDSAGGIGIYEIKFKEREPIKIEIGPDGEWKYIENFEKLQYLKDSLSTQNINWIKSELYLTPLDKNQPAILEYLFRFDQPTRDFILKTLFDISGTESKVKIYAGDTRESYELVAELDQNSNGQPIATDIGSELKASRDKYIKIEMDTNELVSSGVRLRILSAYDHRGAPQLKAEMQPDGETLYSYDFGLEEEKESKWFFDTFLNRGWIQAPSGVLYSAFNPNQGEPLTYKFQLATSLYEGNIKLKTYAYQPNAIQVYAGSALDQMTLIHENDGSEMQEAEIDLSSLRSAKEIYFQIKARAAGTTAQFRKARLELTLQ